jgi:hypothetical protein
MALKFSIYKHPGSGTHYVRCMVCTKKIFYKDSVRITDKYNLLYGKIVCKEDADKTSGQSYPLYPRPETPLDPMTVTGDRPPLYTTDNLSRLPSAPTSLIAKGDTLSNFVRLYWQAPVDSGGGSILGYIIYQANPQLSSAVIINANTNNADTSYLDVNTTTLTSCSYQIAAINEFGTGPLSNVAYFPTEQVPSGIIYIQMSQNINIITTSSGIPITLSQGE